MMADVDTSQASFIPREVSNLRGPCPSKDPESYYNFQSSTTMVAWMCSLPAPTPIVEPYSSPATRRLSLPIIYLLIAVSSRSLNQSSVEFSCWMSALNCEHAHELDEEGHLGKHCYIHFVRLDYGVA